MALWCRDLKTVSVPIGDTPKAVTLVLPYYENPQFFQRQIAEWRNYAADVAPFVSVIVVDDGSPTPAVLPEAPPVSMRLFRIGVDVRWNWLAARNIGAHHAAPGWLLMTDMDHVVPNDTMRACVYGSHDPAVAYGFGRVEHTGAAIHPHSASFFLTRDTFWRTGGYDETLSGHYGTDGDFRRRLAPVARMQIQDRPLVRHEYQGDSSTVRYLRKQPEDAAVKRLVAQRGRAWAPRVLSFPYQEVAAS